MADEDEDRSGGVLGGLPRSRPQRRSQRRPPARAAEPAPKPARGPKAARASKPKPSAKSTAGRKRATAGSTSKPPVRAARKRPPADAPIRQPAQPRHVPPQPRRDADDVAAAAAHEHGVVETAIQAAGELAQIGLTVGGQVLRGALSRLPRP